MIQDLIGSESITFASSNDDIAADIVKQDLVLIDPDPSEPLVDSWITSPSEEPQELSEEVPTILDTSAETDQPSIAIEDAGKATDSDGEKAKNEETLISFVCPALNVTSPAGAQPVFSIGPFPLSSVPPSIVKNVQFSDPLIVGPSNRFFAPVFGASLSSEQVPSTLDSSAGQDSESKEKRGVRSMESVIDSDNVSVDSSSSLETVKEFSTAEAACSSSPGGSDKREASSSEANGSLKQDERKVPSGKTRTPEEALAAREDRLKRLEEQAKWLMNKMNATSRRGSALSTRLEELHEVYGEPPVPPPMPDVLPSRRLATALPDLPRQVSTFPRLRNLVPG